MEAEQIYNGLRIAAAQQYKRTPRHLGTCVRCAKGSANPAFVILHQEALRRRHALEELGHDEP